MDPLMKLNPAIKLIGKLTVSANIKFAFLLFALFWIPTINNKKIEVLKIKMKIIYKMNSNMKLMEQIILDDCDENDFTKDSEKIENIRNV